MQQTVDAIRIAYGDLDQELKQTRKLLAALPEAGLDYQPHAKSYSLGGLAQHVAQLPWLGASIIRADEMDLAQMPRPEPPRSVDDILALFDQAAADARAAFAGLTEAQLAGTWTLRMGDRVLLTRPRGALLRELFISHMIHHRAQLTVYIRLLGAPVPGLYGPSADEM